MLYLVRHLVKPGTKAVLWYPVANPGDTNRRERLSVNQAVDRLSANVQNSHDIIDGITIEIRFNLQPIPEIQHRSFVAG